MKKSSFYNQTHKYEYSDQSDTSAISDSENEDPADYRVGGYHPVHIGDLMHGHYKIISKLGWGHFSTVWLAKDTRTDSQVAIKIVKSESKYREAAMDEIKLLNDVIKRATDLSIPTTDWHVVQLLNQFDLHGPNGRHVCMVFEVLGKNLLQIVQESNYRGLHIPIVKAITRQILVGLDLLHRHCQIIHTDLKLENVMLSLVGSDGQKVRDDLLNIDVKIADLGNACWIHKHFTEDIQTRQYRCPEVILGCGYDEKSDIWSLGCIVFELLTGDLLFKPNRAKFSKEEDHIAQIMELLGPIPRRMIDRGEFSRDIFDRKNELKNIRKGELKYWFLKDVLLDRYSFGQTDAQEITQFLLPLLQVDPIKRCSASEALSFSWLQDENEL